LRGEKRENKTFPACTYFEIPVAPPCKLPNVSLMLTIKTWALLVRNIEEILVNFHMLLEREDFYADVD